MNDQDSQLLCPAGFPVPPGTREWAVLRGDKGPKGDKGEQGEKGKPSTRLPVSQARAVVYLFILNLIFVGLCFWGLVHYIHANNQDRCTTLEEVVAIPVPHPVAGNPSREFEARFEAIEAKRGRQLGCR